MLRHIVVAFLCVAAGADAAATNNFRGSLSRFHMTDTDIGCMASEAFKATPATDSLRSSLASAGKR
jgi:hypothetical protein